MSVRKDIVEELGLGDIIPLSPVSKPLPPPPLSPPVTPPETTVPITKLNWNQLRETALSCQRCPLSKTRKNVAFGDGDKKAHTLFIGEGPGAEEDTQGKPFVGAAGKLLDQMLLAIELNRKADIYIANIIKCRPPDNRNPTAEEAQTCLPFLQRQIQLIQPRLLVALGKVATTYLLNQEQSISNLRQKLHDYQGIPLVVTYHPAYLLRNPQEKKKSWEDLKFIRKLIQEDKPNI